MTAKEQIISNLENLENNNFISKIKFIYYDTIHECTLVFPADSWKLARDAKFTFKQVLEKTSDRSFNLLLWILQFDFDESNHNYFIKEVVLSSLWRPKTDGTSPHEDGRGLDISKIVPNIGGSIVCNSSTATESGFLVKLRTAAMDSKMITQYFSPWIMYTNEAGVITEKPNRGITDNEKLHLTHVHFTISK